MPAFAPDVLLAWVRASHWQLHLLALSLLWDGPLHTPRLPLLLPVQPYCGTQDPVWQMLS